MGKRWLGGSSWWALTAIAVLGLSFSGCGGIDATPPPADARLDGPAMDARPADSPGDRGQPSPDGAEPVADAVGSPDSVDASAVDQADVSPDPVDAPATVDTSVTTDTSTTDVPVADASTPECNVPSDCPGADTDCRTRTCLANLCGFANAPATKAISSQPAGDCHTIYCDGSGGIAASIVDDADLPVDGNECTQDLCNSGVPSNPAVPADTTCGGGKCYGTTCGQCEVAADCPGQDGECRVRTCSPQHTCGVRDLDAGTPVATQTAGDCRRRECDGSGNVVDNAFDADVPDDGNDCTDDLCSGGTASHPARAAGTVCARAQGGRCSTGGGVCLPTFMVVRVGDGAAALSSAASPAFVERRYLDNVGSIVAEAGNPIALPTAASGANQPLTLSNTTRDGHLSLSSDGRYATILGYGAAPGVANISGSANPPVSRVIARIDATNAVDTSTVLTPGLSGGNSRSATSVDGSEFWLAGSGTTGGVHHISFGTSGGTRILASPSSVRSVAVFGGQLYGSSGDTPFSGIFTIATGLPTMPDQTATLLPGMPTMGQSPLSFVLFAISGGAEIFDTLYVADDRTPANGGGIQKWTFDGATWTLATTFNLDPNGTTLTAGMRGLAGAVIGNAVTLVAVGAAGSTNGLNGIFIYRDDGSSTNPIPTLLSTAATNTVYRGISLAP